MSRSFRRTPIMGITTAKSDKPYKVIEHRRERAAVRLALPDQDAIPPTKMFGDPWWAPKDGHQWIDDPRWMRK